MNCLTSPLSFVQCSLSAVGSNLQLIIHNHKTHKLFMTCSCADLCSPFQHQNPVQNGLVGKINSIEQAYHEGQAALVSNQRRLKTHLNAADLVAHSYSGRTVKGSLVPFGTGLSLKFTSCCKAQNMPSSPLQKIFEQSCQKIPSINCWKPLCDL